MRKAVKTFVIAFALLIYGAGALADDGTTQVIKRQAPEGITNAFYACIGKAGSDNIALAACQSAEKKRQDARLNIAYKALLGKLNNADAKENLISAERAWLDFHRKSDDFESSLYGSDSVQALDVALHEIFRLCERANTLKKYLYIAEN